MDPEFGRGGSSPDASGPLGTPAPSSGGPLATPPPSMGASDNEGRGGFQPDSNMASLSGQPNYFVNGQALYPNEGLNPNDHRPISYTMNGAAQGVMARQNFPVDPYNINFAPGGGDNDQGHFELIDKPGVDLFGSVLPRSLLSSSSKLADIPQNLQPLLAPALTRFYRDSEYQGGAAHGQMSAPWTRFFAPRAADVGNGAIEHTWPGITRVDPWGRSMGEYPNLYS